MGEDREPELERLEQRAREALERDLNVREEVRAITTEALSRGRLDTDRVRAVIDAAMDGINAGAGDHAAKAKRRLGEASAGIDEALAQAAHAAGLALDEARSRFARFSEDDLARAGEDLRSLETIFVNTLRRLARSGDETLRSGWADLERHARDSGTEVGAQTREAFEEAGERVREATEEQARASVSAALAAGAQLAEAASGFLSGLADTLEETRRAREAGASHADPRPVDDEEPPEPEP